MGVTCPPIGFIFPKGSIQEIASIGIGDDEKRVGPCPSHPFNEVCKTDCPDSGVFPPFGVIDTSISVMLFVQLEPLQTSNVIDVGPDTSNEDTKCLSIPICGFPSGVDQDIVSILPETEK